jgi:hypothetical protein
LGEETWEIGDADLDIVRVGGVWGGTSEEEFPHPARLTIIKSANRVLSWVFTLVHI